MKSSISLKIILMAAVGVVASSVLILCISTFMLGNLLTRTMEDDMLGFQSIVERMQNQEKERLMHNVSILANMPEFVEAVYRQDWEEVKEIARSFRTQLNLDSVAITDAGGIVMARGHSDRVGDDFNHRSTTRAAFRGEIKAGILFDEEAVLPFTIRCDAPVYKDGVIIGTISLAINIGSEEYVDNFRLISGKDFTIFKGDTIYMTSMRNADGERKIGDVSYVLPDKNEVLIVREEVYGEPVLSAYWLIENVDGRIIGMWSLSKLLSYQEKETNGVLIIVILCSLGVMLATLLAASVLGKRIALPISKTTDYAVQVAEGNLGVALDVHSNDEVGRLVSALQTMVNMLKTRIMEAEAANKAKSAFLSTMSHEIRTPMNAILGIAEIQLQKEGHDQETGEAFDKIQTSGDLLLGIINDILDLSKIEAGKLELLDIKYEVASLISDTAQLNMMRVGSKPIEFELNVDENIPACLSGDELRVKQILNNLLSNAFKYTGEGKVVMSVSSEPHDNDETTLIISVSDTGQGMTKEQVEKLFDEYSRFNQETNRSTEGTGLGMSITNNLVRLMSGTLSVESEPGKGSVFTLRLPQRINGNEMLGAEVAENLRQFRTRSRAQMKRVQITREPMPYGKVLIVDDVETNIYVAKGLLSPYGLQIDSADSGFAAIDKVKSGKEYDIIFMDHMMPKMDGIEATKHIRDLGYKLPIVALTANAVMGQADVFLSNGFNDFVSKPIDIRQMNVILNKLIRDKQPPEVIEAARNKAVNPFVSVVQASVDAVIIEAFLRDAIKALAKLEAIVKKNGYTDENDMRTYIINVHGIKAALANVGNPELSAVAAKLEKAGRENNIKTITDETPAFLKSLRSFVDGLTPEEENAETEAVEENTELLKEKLLII
ncbi:MAG: ATP-binding protein, partial [Oscillospiraceae bacterium]|nr:ATP-binding protein [Oscillospiraceae bacterium]